MTESKIQQLIREQRLPDSFTQVVCDVYQPICAALDSRFGQSPTPAVIGINGCPGSGKSTMALFLQAVLESQYGYSVEIISIDDFYKTKRERLEMSENIHPLFKTRGVPGTHDVELAMDTIRQLKNVNQSRQCYIPRFDKASDDRHAHEQWQAVKLTPNFIILEGWCVAATAQKPVDLDQPINSLEQELDANGEWRNFVNDELKGHYKTLFTELSYLIVLQPPTPDIVLKWRIQQEEKLRESVRSISAEDGINRSVGMSNDELVQFVMHYERLIRHMHQSLPSLANIFIELDERRRVTGLTIRS